MLRKKIKPQVKGILTQYGDLCLMWFDNGSVGIPEECSKELVDMVKHYQPNCLVNSRIGNGMGDYRSCGDNELPDASMTDELIESPITLNKTSDTSFLAMIGKVQVRSEKFLINVNLTVQIFCLT